MSRRKKTTRRKHRSSRRSRTRVNTRRHRGGMAIQRQTNNAVVSVHGVTMTLKEFADRQQNPQGPLE